MLDPDSFIAPTPVTTARLVELYGTTRPLLVALRDVAKPLTRRSRPVPARIVAEAQSVLTAARQVLSRERGARRLLALEAAPDWATLHSTLELALAAFASFRERYSYFDRRYGMPVWRDESWLSLQRLRVESASVGNGLHES